MNNTPIRHAIILAAGRGSRLGGEAEGASKALIDVGGETIIRFQIRQLRAAGIDDLTVVTGFKVDEVREHLAGEEIEFIHNPEYATTNSLHSLSLARERALGGTLVLNSDVLFHPECLRRLLAQDWQNAILVDFESELSDEEMKVRVDANNVVTAISKELTPEPGMGENLGIIRMGAEGARAFFDCAADLIATGEKRAWAPHCIQLLIGKTPFHAVAVNGLPWTEIDFPADLVYAREEIHPKCALPVPTPSN